ncbi:lysylphosphatidylglycerol synthase domain-containing protein [Rhodocista pekingensis]|uniref:Lysylphosphatidylglycerol synthase domain-containing protein n=1 Tax=Rhodocista pekingensis TaxID=201185 RepID=A0ABW2KRG6_9PROT
MDSSFDTAREAARSEPTPTAGGSETARPSLSARARTWSGIASFVILVILAVVAVRHVMHEVDVADVWAYLDALPLWKVLEALALTAAGYMVLTLYDVSALRYLNLRVRYPTVALASFAGYAISNNVGWAVISGGSVRYRVYSAAGLSAGTIAKVVVFSTTTFTLGVSFTGSIGMLVGPHPVASLLSLPEWLVQVLAGVTLAGLLALCVLAEVTRKPVKVWRWSFQLPSSGLMLAQIAIASLEILIAGAALWLLLPQTHGASFMEFLGIYCAALVVAMVSHIPGGLGVFETILLLGLSAQGSAGGVLGALLAYRFIYYVLPLVVAGMLLAAWELKTASGPAAALRALSRRVFNRES